MQFKEFSWFSQVNLKLRLDSQSFYRWMFCIVNNWQILGRRGRKWSGAWDRNCSLHGKFGFKKVKAILFCCTSLLTSSPPIHNNWLQVKILLVGFHHFDITFPQERDGTSVSNRLSWTKRKKSSMLLETPTIKPTQNQQFRLQAPLNWKRWGEEAGNQHR